ncbi:hypothetical protein GF339_05685 [candidate division KSB3 bacterium]|uniref:PpiC domain-containing protein n=1 Tax=candidate division KSB3 bacterium TaxID=2044937 RepID=A0A9D5JTZ2_9BACT|nr:hypothetical protein [candidate division KSB3 bacterium]MBD3324055.1 hypothetical protein [candidate division KSB3 bacterium]
MKWITKAVMCLGCLTLLSTTTSAEIVDRIVAVVNRKVITLYQLRQAEQQIRSQQNISPEDSPEARREKVLNFLIENELIRQEAQEMGVLVSDEELQAALQDIKQRNDIQSDEQFRRIVNQEGRTWAEFLEDIREQIKIAKLINREVRSRVEISEDDVTLYYHTHQDEFEQSAPAVHIRHILLGLDPDATPAAEEAAQAQAEDLVQQLRAGADFSTLAQEYSDHPSADAGGELGTFKEGDLAPPFDVAFTMDAGEISDPIRSEMGLHIIYVEDKTGGEQASFENAKPLIRRKLFEQQSAALYQEWLDTLKEKAYIEIK